MGDAHCTFILIAHPQRKRLHSAMEKEDRVRIHRAAKMIELLLYFPDPFRGSDTGAGDDV